MRRVLLLLFLLNQLCEAQAPTPGYPVSSLLVRLCFR